MKQYVKRWAAVAVVALGVMSAQAKAASVAVNVSSAGVNLVVVDDKKAVNHHGKMDKKDHKKLHCHHHKVDKHKKVSDRHRYARRVEQKGRKMAKLKR